jgi:phosphoserine phosphatase
VTERFLVVCDIDSTLINEEGLDLLAHFAGGEIAQAVEAITHRAMVGELDFAQSLIARVALLEGLPLSLISEVADRLTLTHGAVDLIDAVHRAGGLVGAVSGGFHELVDPLATRIGLDHWLANRFEHDGRQLTGRVAGEIVDASAKAAFVTGWAADSGISLARTVAIGDGANDVAMFDVVGLSVSFCGKPVADRRATVRIEERNLARVLDYLPDLLLVAHAEAAIDGDNRSRNITGGI